MRAGYLDNLRALAVVWMIIFHFTYDLRMFQLNQIDFSQGFWFAFPRVIAGTFLFCVGLSLHYTHQNKVNPMALLKRVKKLGLAALAVSVGTYFAFPTQWVYFGTLHCILVGSLLGAFFVQRRKLALIVMITIIVFQYGFNYDIKWVSSTLQRPSMDFIPIYPWFWVILLGILVAPFLSKNQLLTQMPVPRLSALLGRHSLSIYLIHQPLIFGSIYLYQLFQA